MKKSMITIALFLLIQISWSILRAQSVSYLSPVYNSTASDSITSGINHWVTKSCTNYIQVSDTNTVWGVKGSDTWYVVSSNHNINHRIECYGHTHLILVDGCNINISNNNIGTSLNVDANASLEIYAQSTDTATMGRLTSEALGDGLYSGAGIGGKTSTTNKYIIINGGFVTAIGKGNCAGIGGGGLRDEVVVGKNITINGGLVKAHGSSAGIGGGFFYSGGIPSLTASHITINGGIIFADGESGCGIGSGPNGNSEYITINGGTITANGGEYGAGIGAVSECSYINITGGDITAQGGPYRPGIGGSTCHNISISGGNIVAVGHQNAAGIGASDECENINIYGGNIIANGGEYGSGIGGETCSNIFFSDDMIVKAGMSANPTSVIPHTVITDMSPYLAGKRYVTAIDTYLQEFEVTVTVNDTEMGSVIGWGTYNYGDTVTLVAVANAGYKFDKWTSDNMTYTENPYTFIVTNDVTFTAYFESNGSDVEIVEDNANVSLTPNPIHIGECAYLNVSDGSKIEIYNSNGLCLKSLFSTSGIVTIEGLNVSGVYVVRVTDVNGKMETRKLIVE